VSTELPHPAPTLRLIFVNEEARQAFERLLIDEREKHGVLAFAGFPNTPDPVIVEMLLDAGEKLTLIHYVRTSSGVSLRAAKDYVEGLYSDRRYQGLLREGLEAIHEVKAVLDRLEEPESDS
jgi:ribosomal protein L7/L12